MIDGMMKIQIYLLQKKADAFYQKAMDEYLKRLQDLSVRGESSIDFYIGYGGEDDMEPFCLSSFTMEPSLTATVLLEQIYRAYRIMNHQAYHK